jgi:hypothetical protein
MESLLKYLSVNKAFMLKVAVVLSVLTLLFDMITMSTGFNFSIISLVLLGFLQFFFYRKISCLPLLGWKFPVALILHSLYLIFTISVIEYVSSLITTYNLTLSDSPILVVLISLFFIVFTLFSVFYSYNFSLNFLFLDQGLFKSLKDSFRMKFIAIFKFIVAFAVVASVLSSLSYFVSFVLDMFAVDKMIYGFFLNIIQYFVIMGLYLVYMCLTVDLDKNKTA